jgi:hypothetical protein
MDYEDYWQVGLEPSDFDQELKEIEAKMKSMERSWRPIN